MAQDKSTTLSPNWMNRSDSNLSIASTRTTDSTHSTASAMLNSIRRKRKDGILDKVSSGFQSIFRRFSRPDTSLTERELQMLIAATNYTREEVIQW